MAEPTKKGKKGVKTRQAGGQVRRGRIDRAVRRYVAGLSEEHRMLVVLKAELYGGSWEPMLDDLKNRLAGKPYIFKLVNRIKDDIERIEQMQKYEAEHNVDLAEYVELS